MKSSIMLLGSFVLLFCPSCSENELRELDNTEGNTEFFTEHVTPDTPLPFIVKRDTEELDIGENAPNGRSLNWIEHGPFTVSATLTRTGRSLKKPLLNHPILAQATYLCDIYKCYYEVTLPVGAIMLFDGSSKMGFTGPSEGEVGVSVTQVNNRVTIITWCLVPRYTFFGQRLNVGAYPINLTGTTFTYSYLRRM